VSKVLYKLAGGLLNFEALDFSLSSLFVNPALLVVNPALTTSGTYQSMLMKVARNAIRKVPEAVLYFFFYYNMMYYYELSK
jgi:hypothetical protein